MWTPVLYAPQGISTQATFPVITAVPPSTWTAHNQPGTVIFALPNTNTPVQLQNSWQNSPLAQAIVQPTSGWIQTDAIPYILHNIPQTPSSSLHILSGYAFGSSLFIFRTNLVNLNGHVVTISTPVRSLLTHLKFLLNCIISSQGLVV